MATAYKTPGVYIEEIPKFPPSIAPVETAIPAFVGYTEKAIRNGEDLTNKPIRIESIAEYEEVFGGAPSQDVQVFLNNDNNFVSAQADSALYLYDSLRMFYANGGGNCFIISVGKYPTSNASIAAADIETGLGELEKEDEPTIIIMPDAVSIATNGPYSVQQKALGQCFKLMDRVTLCDLVKTTDYNTFRSKVEEFRTAIGINALKYGASYGPWINANLPRQIWHKNLKLKRVGTGSDIELESLTTDANISKLIRDIKLAETAEKSLKELENNKTLDDALRQALDKYRLTTAASTSAELTSALQGFTKLTFDALKSIQDINKPATLYPSDTNFKITDTVKSYLSSNPGLRKIILELVMHHKLQGADAAAKTAADAAKAAADTAATAAANKKADVDTAIAAVPAFVIAANAAKTAAADAKTAADKAAAAAADAKTAADASDPDAIALADAAKTAADAAKADADKAATAAADTKTAADAIAAADPTVATKADAAKTAADTAATAANTAATAAKDAADAIAADPALAAAAKTTADAAKTAADKAKAAAETAAAVPTASILAAAKVAAAAQSDTAEATKAAATAYADAIANAVAVNLPISDIIQTGLGVDAAAQLLGFTDGASLLADINVTVIAAVTAQYPTTVDTLKKRADVALNAAHSAAINAITIFHSIQASTYEFEKNLNDTLLAAFGKFKELVTKGAEALNLLPPSGAIAGVYASVDRDRGVWKAPANVSLNSVIGPAVKISQEQQADFNIDVNAGKSINIIRAFTGKGTLVWGARTLAGNDNEWRYVSVRRFFNFVEESTKKATEQFVFEPNDANTWVKVQAMIENFLTTLWRQGALQGVKPEHAFYVAVGLGKTMTALDILEGRMIVEIGMAVVRPAEFIILRFSHKMPES